MVASGVTECHSREAAGLHERCVKPDAHGSKELSNNAAPDGTSIKPLKQRLQKCTSIGRLWILYVFKSGRAVVLGPHWFFALVMFFIHLGVGLGLALFLSFNVSFFPHTFVLSCITFFAMVFFLLTTLSDPGILLSQDLQPKGDDSFGQRADTAADGVERAYAPDGHVAGQGSLDSHPSSRPRVTAELTVLAPRGRPRRPSAFSDISDDSTHNYDVVYEDVENETLFPYVPEDGVDLVSNVSSSATSSTRRARLWCRHCELMVPKKTQHCTDCKVCIRGYDHHCPWTSKCIGVGNIHYFYGWIGLVLLSLVYFAVIGALTTSYESDATIAVTQSPNALESVSTAAAAFFLSLPAYAKTVPS